MRVVYLDNAATTPVDRRVVEAMLPHLEGPAFGNPSSAHALGLEADRAVRASAERLLRATHADGAEFDVVFTSGGTEADVLATLGLARAAGKRRHVVVSAIEHSAVLGACEILEEEGFSVTRVQPDRGGVVQPAAVADAVREDTGLVSVMMVQNELGTCQPVGAIARAVRTRAPAAAIATDAVQALGKLPLEVTGLDVDAVALSAHKIHGPKGTGALLVRKTRRLKPLWRGKQQGGLRAGTENVAGIVGLGVAAELCEAARIETIAQMARQRDALWEAVQAAIPGARKHGDPIAAAPHVLAIGVPGSKAEVILHALEARGVMVSAGSACAARDRKPSHVLKAIGVPDDEAVLRWSFARTTTDADVADASAAVAAVARELGLADGHRRVERR
jgi:cysteine desulfurase